MTREHNGGLLDLVTLHRLVERRRGSAANPVSLDDILQAIKKLEVSDTHIAYAMVIRLQLSNTCTCH